MSKEARSRSVILDMVYQRSTNAGKLIQPVINIPVEDIAASDTITGKYTRILRRHGHLGIQFDWIARYAHEKNIFDIELCICKSDLPQNDVWEMMVDNYVPDGSDSYRLDKNLPDSDLDIFLPFRFPVISKTKHDMYLNSKQYGYDDILMKTWFCLTPHGEIPCGTCNPCMNVIENAMNFRMPWRGRLHYHKKKLLSRLIKQRETNKKAPH